MIKSFFKQSKPEVFTVLCLLITTSFLNEIWPVFHNSFSLENVGVYASKFLAILASFFIFVFTLKQYEIQHKHSLGSLYFTLFCMLNMHILTEHYIAFALLFLSISLVTLYKILESKSGALVVFNTVIFLGVAILIEPNFILMLLMVFAASLLYRKTHWRLFITPVYAISAIVVLIKAYLLTTGVHFSLDIFFTQFLDYKPLLLHDYSIVNQLVLWVFISVIFVYQILKVNQKRALYHKANAKFFLYFVVLALASIALTRLDISKLWVLSIWPFSIYIADFLWRIKSKIWSEVMLILSFIIVFIFNVI